MAGDVERSDAVALFERRRDAWLAEDADAYLALFADDLVLETPSVRVESLAEYTNLVRNSYKAIRPISFEFHEIAVHGPKVLAEWTITMEYRRGGAVVSYHGMSICELREGLIRTWREFYDPADLRPRD